MILKKYHIFNRAFSQLIGLSFNREYIRTNKVYIFPQTKEAQISIHTFLMKYPIRIITLDKDFKVIENRIIKPLKVYKPEYKYQYLLETRTGNLRDINKGMIIEWN